MLADRRINTNPLTEEGSSNDSNVLGELNGSSTKKENEQNVKNRAREVKFGGDIERSASNLSAV